MSYDQGYWHTDKCTELGIDEGRAGTHIAVYVKWCLERSMLNAPFSTEDGEARECVTAGRMTAAEYFEKHLDWKFGQWNLNDSGNAFTSRYYDRYLQDLKEGFPEVIYGDESKVSFQALSEFLDRQLEEYKAKPNAGFPQRKKPWWKLW